MNFQTNSFERKAGRIQAENHRCRKNNVIATERNGMGKEKTPELPPKQRLEKTSAPEEVRRGPISRTWKRITRREPISDQPGWSIQNNAEESALRDLEKPIEQLLSDIHEAHEMRMDDLRKEGHRDPVLLTLYTLKRTASMMAAVATSNDDLAKANIKL
jgi:hypothetical protein